jgi:hypothetical protein
MGMTVTTGTVIGSLMLALVLERIGHIRCDSDCLHGIDGSDE